jgi:hypothetical protein
VSAAAGERVLVQGRLSVRDPDRWWPRGFGTQNRYVVRATLGACERTATTGFRTVEYDAEGMSINGTRLPVRGLVVLPGDEHASEIVERAIETNATLVRPYGHVPPKSFYEAADAAGMVVVQDVPMGAGALDAERARSVARTLAGAVGHRPSLAAFGVHDDAHAFDVTTEEEGWRVLRSTGDDDGAATATAAAAALPDDATVLPLAGLDAGTDREGASWVVDGYSGSGARTRYVVPEADGAAIHVERAIEALRLSDKPLITAFRPPEVGTDAVRAAFEPVAAFLNDPIATEPRAVVVNDTPEPVAGDLDWTAGGESGALSVAVDALSREVVGELPVPADAARIELAFEWDGQRTSSEYER